MSQELNVATGWGIAARSRGRWPAQIPHVPTARWLFAVVAVACAIPAAWWLIDGVATWATLSELAGRPELVALILLTYTAAFALRAEAWRALAPQPGVRRFAILQASLFLNHLLPVKAGEVARPALAARQGMPFAMAASSTVVARMLDLAVLAVIAAVLLPLAAASGASVAAALALLGLLAVATAGVVALRAARTAPGWLPGRLVQAFEAAGDGLRTISRQRLGAAALFTAPSWLLEGAVVFAVAEAAGTPLAIHAAIGVTAATIAMQVVHITPGGLGVYEATMTGALAAYGVPPSEGLVIATAAHAVKFAYAFTVGAAALPFACGRVSQ